MASNLKIKLIHYHNPELGLQWHALFENEPDVEILETDLMEIDCDALVSPGNSFGFMDGGLDLLISQKFGWGIQAALQQKIQALPTRELLVGQATVIEALHPKMFIVCAPTMRVPENVSESINAYLAMKAALIICKEHTEIYTVAISGLCTGTGHMPADIAALQMFTAYEEVIKNEHPVFHTFREATRHQLLLKKHI